MSLISPMVMDNGAQRPMFQGDLTVTGENTANAIANAAGVTWSGPQVAQRLLLRSGAAGVSDTTPDSNTWLSSLINGFLGSGPLSPLGVQVGATYRFMVLNANTGTLTIVAGTGVTLAGTTTITTVLSREYLVTVLNGTPQQVFAATTTNASAIITGLTAAQTSLITPGMLVSGTGIPAAATILSVQPGVGFTLSANATATGSLVALTFNPRIEFRGLFQAAN